MQVSDTLIVLSRILSFSKFTPNWRVPFTAEQDPHSKHVTDLDLVSLFSTQNSDENANRCLRRRWLVQT